MPVEATSGSEIARNSGHMRMHFDRTEKVIPPFLMSLKQEKFKLTPSCKVMELEKL